MVQLMKKILVVVLKILDAKMNWLVVNLQLYDKFDLDLSELVQTCSALEAEKRWCYN
jgi:hypothetical protein